MESHELLRNVFQKISPKQAAAELGLSLSMVYKWAEPPERRSGAANPLDRVAVLMHCSEDTQIAQWICQKGGGFFVKNPRHAATAPLPLVPALHAVVQEFADLLSVIAAAANANQMGGSESKSVRARWEELKSDTERFVTCCEREDFRNLDRHRESRK
jgi:hypothetical protein